MLRFQARLHGLPRATSRRRIPEVLEQVGIADRARSLIGHLSRGQRQRVGLAVALLHDPEVLVLDEPTSGLDPLQRLEMRTLLRGLAEKHTVLLSSHILPEVEAIAPRVIILSRGRIAADGTQEELVRRLGGASAVRLEAVLGPDVEGAVRLLRSLRGVRDVVDEGRAGIHHSLRIPCDEDLREDVGALAAARGWALRELSWRRPTLEQIFARIALGTAEEPPVAPAADEGTVAANLGQLVGLGSSSGSAGMASAGAAAPKVVYNLNPFDMGASRDLGRPKAIEGATLSAAAQRAREADLPAERKREADIAAQREREAHGDEPGSKPASGGDGGARAS